MRDGGRRVAVCVTLCAVIVAAGASWLLWRGHWRYAQSLPASSEASDCSDCGLRTEGVLSHDQLSLDDVRERELEAARRRATQGLLVGEPAPNLSDGISWSRCDLWYVLFVEASSQMLDPGTVFTFCVLRDWLIEFEDAFRVVLVLSDQGSRKMLVAVQNFFRDSAIVLLDQDDQIRVQLRIEPDAPRLAYLVNSRGDVVSRLSPLRPEIASSLHGHIEASLASGHAADAPDRFAAIHSEQIEESIWDLAGTHVLANPHFPLQAVSRHLPTLVYHFGIDCTPCNTTSELAYQLAAELEGRVNLAGLSFALSPVGIDSAKSYGEAYAHARSPSQQQWLDGLPKSNADVSRFLDGVKARSANYADAAPVPFPVFMDWDRRLSGNIGLGISSVPCWALYNSQGKLVEIFPAATETLYEDGKPIELAFPSFEYLYSYVHEFLDALRDE